MNIAQSTSLMALIAMFFCSCGQAPKKQEVKETSSTDVSTTAVDNQATIPANTQVIKVIAEDSLGGKLEVEFDNINDKAIVNFRGEKVEMINNRPGSGMWYKNDHYELRGKGEEFDFSKDGKVVFHAVRSIP